VICPPKVSSAPKERVAPDRIEMGGNFAEEDERRQSAIVAMSRVRQNQSGEKRLLFSRGGLRRRDLFRAVAHAKIARLRPDQGAPRRRVAGPVAAQNAMINVFGFQRRASPHQALDFALQGDIRPWKGRGFIPRLRNKRRKPRHGLNPGRGNSDGEFGGFPFDRVEPAAIGARALL
jgi:hypothetical protein